jgi:WD40 repeat protein
MFPHSRPWPAPCRWDFRGPEYGHLANQLAKKTGLTLPTRGRVVSVALSGDGKRLCAGGYDNTITVWDLGPTRAEGVR